MEFKFNFDKLYEKIKLHLIAEFNIFDDKLLRYIFVESHPKYRDANGMPYIDVLYKSVDKKGISLTPIRINENKPTMTVLNDSDFSKANLYYGNLFGEDQHAIDAVFTFICHKEKIFSKRTESIKGKEAGEFFRELNKLAVLDNKEKYFVYVFDLPMKNYYERLMDSHSSHKFLEIVEGVPKDKITVKSEDFDTWSEEVLCTKHNTTPGYNFFHQKAFSLFRKYRFADFNYEIDTLYSNILIDGRVDKYYIVIGKVK